MYLDVFFSIAAIDIDGEILLNSAHNSIIVLKDLAQVYCKTVPI